VRFDNWRELTPFKAAFAAALAFLLPPLAATPIKLTHQQSLLKNSQYLLLLVRISSIFHPLIVINSINSFKKVEIVRSFRKSYLQIRN
jgi:hypothetical protein